MKLQLTSYLVPLVAESILAYMELRPRVPRAICMETKDFIDSVRHSARSPIALVGIGCRFPGNVNGPKAFWRLLCDGTDAIGEIPNDRIDVSSYYDPRPEMPGKMSTRYGGFLQQIDMFDAPFFGISPREAERMDPQQRLLLQVSWEALEDAGQSLHALDSAAVGVFVGLWLQDYEARLFSEPQGVDFYMTTGTGRYSASGRLSYFYGFQGPSLTVDTACSSSLVAVHLACRSIWSGECSLALAGGANVILQPHISIAYSQSRMLAPDGRCKFGDASANGYVRSEGAGVVVLKPLADALRDGDRIYALIQGSAVNNDGSSSGYLTTPARAGQEDLLRKAYRDAGVSPGRVQYVEAHGTGTVAGDPVEIGALGTVLSLDRAPGEVCYLGSVKTNFGHTEGAAGIAGLIKTALILKHRVIPASLHLKKPNPAIPWKDYAFEIPQKLMTWPSSSETAIAGVSAFGIAGTNAHVVLAKAPTESKGDPEQGADCAYLLPISARSPEALVSLARSYHSVLDGDQGAPLGEVAFTAALRRTHHDYRLAAVADTRSKMCDMLEAFSRGERVPGLWTNRVEAGAPTRVVFVCPGQGSQWVGMGRQLLGQEPVFRQALHECEQAMRPFVDWSLHDQLLLEPHDPGYRLDQIDVIQPTLLSIEIALAALWRSWSIHPDAVVGHSMGEVAAAFISGALNLDDAMRIICTRSRLLHTVRGQGAMAVVALPLDKAEQTVARFRDRISAAVSNSPRSTVLSGDPSVIGSILEELQARDIFCRLVKVDVASHSPQMDSLKEELLGSLSTIEPREEKISIYSTVTGNKIDGKQLDSTYWTRNLRSPVLFSTAVKRLAEDGHAAFIELSPHPILLPSIEETLHDMGANGYAIPSFEREKDERSSMLSSVARLYAMGFPIEWRQLFSAGRKLVDLPSYPWQYQRFWIDQPCAHRPAADSSDDSVLHYTERHPLLGVRLPSVAALPSSSIWQTTFGDLQHRLRRSQVNDSNPLPEKFVVDIVSAAANAIFGEKLFGISELKIHEALDASVSSETKIQFMLTQTGEQLAGFQLSSFAPAEDNGWKLHVSGTIEAIQANSNWLYEPDWKRKSLVHHSSPNPSGKPERWLIFADHVGTAAAFAELLQSIGEDVSLAFSGSSFRIEAANGFSLSWTDPNDIERLLDHVFKTDDKTCRIVYLWGLNSADSLEHSYARNCHALLYLVQSLAKRNCEKPPRIWIVTRGAQAVDSASRDSLALQQAPLWGMGRVIALEHPDLFGGLVDLPAIEQQHGSSLEVAQRLYQEFLTQDGEDQIALRDDGRYVFRLVRSQSGAVKRQELVIHPDATYLVTGGLGGLGLQLAKWLVDQGARHLVLTSRTGLPERHIWESIARNTELGRRIAAIEALENNGAEVAIHKADVADESEMSALWKELAYGHPPVRGIIHAAGVANPRSLIHTKGEDAREVFRPKINGAWILHQLTTSRSGSNPPLDFFVLFSSAASLLGAQDLGPYAAANHFMDCLAQRRAALGLPALCVNWGWWDSPGLVSERLATLFEGAGLKALPPEQALSTLRHLLETGVTQATVANVDWNIFRPVFEAKRVRPFLEHMSTQPRTREKANAVSDEKTETVGKQIQRAPAAERRQLLQNFISMQVAEILGFKLSYDVNLHQGFFKMGMDSMMTVQLRNRLESNLGCSLPPTVAFEYPNVDSLTGFIAKDLIQSDDRTGTPAMNSPHEETLPLSELDKEELSEEELLDLLAKKVEQIR